MRVFTATDGCGNTATAYQTINITSEVTETCPEDLNGDSFVGVNDVLLVLGQFGCTAECAIDLDNDDATSVNDLLSVLSAFGDAC